MRKAFSWTAVALSLLLCACTGPGKWSKDGVTPEAAAADYADCRAQAQNAIRRDVNIDADIEASRATDRDKSQTRSTYDADDAHANRQLTSQMVSGCMQSKGYAPTGPETNESPHLLGLFNL